jgi:2-hydroxy-6-oxonona-2,4-dienedioate hydrolase
MTGKTVLRVIGLVLAVALSAGYVRYRRDLQQAESAAAESTLGKTQCGDVEFVSSGTGPPVLVLHGTGGGWDQGLTATEGLVARGFRVIAPSRPGYLRTPLPKQPSPQGEADLWACFLTSLDIEHAAVIGISAGATPAAQLALRYPKRVDALVLMVPASGGLAEPDNEHGPSQWVMNVMLRWDFPYWMTMRLAPGTMIDLVAVPRSLAVDLAPADRAVLDRTIAQMLPISRRRHGIAYDAATQSTSPVFPLERITAPTLLITAKDDGYRTQRPARRAASVIPHATLIEYETGGHLLLGHAEEVASAIAAFLLRAED